MEVNRDANFSWLVIEESRMDNILTSRKDGLPSPANLLHSYSRQGKGILYLSKQNVFLSFLEIFSTCTGEKGMISSVQYTSTGSAPVKNNILRNKAAEATLRQYGKATFGEDYILGTQEQSRGGRGRRRVSGTKWEAV